MKLTLAPFGAVLLALAASQPVAAQFLKSQSLSRPAARTTLSFKLERVAANTTFTVTTTGALQLSLTAPATVVSDARGYAAFQVEVQSLLQNFGPVGFQVTVADVSLPNGSITKKYSIKVKNGVISSAWPEFVMSQGVFCNPAALASSHLQIDRATDIDGDGVYGDLFIEANGSTVPDSLDFPSEFSCDVNSTGAGTAAGLFLPGAAGRTVAFCTDNRIVITPSGPTCAFTTLLNFIEDMAFARAFNGKPTLFATSSSNDNVLICRDTNGDGNITASEISVFFAPTVLVNNENFSPDGIALDPTAPSRLYWITDKSGATGSKVNQGLFRLEDANADDVIGANEWKPSWTGTTAPVVVETNTVDASEFECLHVDSKGGVLLNHTELGTIFRWFDSNANGVAETGEVVNWLTYNMTQALYTKSVAFQQPNFPVLTGTFWSMNLIESVARPGQGDLHFVALTNSTGVGAGFVFRCEDLNNDGDVNDLGEVTVFWDPAVNADPTPFVSGLAVTWLDENGNQVQEPSEIVVYVAQPNGPKPLYGFSTASDLNVWRYRDLDANGNAFAIGENERVMIHPTGAFNRGLELVPSESDGGFRLGFYQRSQLTTVKTAGCLTPLGESIELDSFRDKLEEGTQGTPFGGNTAFGAVTRGNGSGAGTVCGLGLGNGVAASPIPIFGCNFWLQAPFFVDVIPPALPDANGVAKFPLPIPANVRGTIALQAFTVTAGKVILGETSEMRIE